MRAPHTATRPPDKTPVLRDPQNQTRSRPDAFLNRRPSGAVSRPPGAVLRGPLRCRRARRLSPASCLHPHSRMTCLTCSTASCNQGSVVDSAEVRYSSPSWPTRVPTTAGRPSCRYPWCDVLSPWRQRSSVGGSVAISCQRTQRPRQHGAGGALVSGSGSQRSGFSLDRLAACGHPPTGGLAPPGTAPAPASMPDNSCRHSNTPPRLRGGMPRGQIAGHLAVSDSDGTSAPAPGRSDAACRSRVAYAPSSSCSTCLA